jgi:hypothetical protein
MPTLGNADALREALQAGLAGINLSDPIWAFWPTSLGHQSHIGRAEGQQPLARGPWGGATAESDQEIGSPSRVVGLICATASELFANVRTNR